MKKVGIIYNAGEQNAVVNATKAKEAISSLGLEPVEVTIANGNEVKQAAETLVSKKIQAFYIPKDNTVVAALESVIQVAEQNKIPLFVGEGDSVKRGGFASYGIEYFDLGYRTGEMAADILLNGKKPTEIPVEFPKNLELVINLKAAKAQGIEVPEELRKNAVKVIE
ncbi:ABC transporter substrate-binding protein [Microaerobacter geothermalis]|nr:ABC transporter substrate-binding protein [Microaerobacter geothermalis]